MNLDDDFGIVIVGGIDIFVIFNNSFIVIINVVKGSIVDGKFR